jgi:hypothetical protein
VDHGRLDNWTEGLIIVDVGSLGKVVKYPMSLVSFQRAVGVELVLKNPFVGDDARANGVMDKTTVVVGDQGSKFFFHDAVIVWIDESITDGGGHR